MYKEFHTEAFPDRKNTNSVKYDTINSKYGREDLIPLWVADMDFPSPDCIKEAMRKYLDFGVYAYYAPPASYAQAFIEWEKKRHNLIIEKNWIVFSPGVITGMAWSINALTKPGDSIVILTPCYYPFMNIVHETKRNLVCSNLVNDNGIYTVDIADLEQKIVENDVKLMLLCNPHNPVGHVWTRSELYNILRVCKKHDVVVVSDEIHQDIIFPGHKQISAIDFSEFHENVIVFTAASKTFNLAGLQNSFGIIPDVRVRTDYNACMQSIHIKKGVPFGYIAAEAGFRGGEQWLEECLDYMAGNQKTLVETLTSALPKIVVTPLEGTFMTWIDLSAYVKPENVEKVVRDDASLAVDYGFQFWPKELVPEDDAHIRINIATSRENLVRAANQLVAAIKAQ